MNICGVDFITESVRNARVRDPWLVARASVERVIRTPVHQYPTSAQLNRCVGII